MKYFWGATAAVCSGFGLVYGPNTAGSENGKGEGGSWLSWLVAEKPADGLEIGRLVPLPGRLVVWGGKFGRSPRSISGISDKIVKVSAAESLGAAVDDDGNVHGFHVSKDSDNVAQIHLGERAVDVAVREASSEIFILDSGGKLHVSKCVDEKTFDPARLLEGAMRRTSIEKVRCGREHCIAVSSRGEAFAWGSNSHGQLGLGQVGDLSDVDPEIPRKLILPDGVRIRDASCGRQHTILLDRNGTVFGVGNDQWAQLGVSAEPWLRSHEKASGEVRKSSLVGELAGRAVAGGGQHSVMLVRDGTVFSFGFNRWGQLGHHNYSSLAPPSPTADITIRAIAVAAGENHTCIVKDNGEMWCIGGNDHGQLGNGNLQPTMVWKRVRVAKKPLKPCSVSLSGNTSAAIFPVNKDREQMVS